MTFLASRVFILDNKNAAANDTNEYYYLRNAQNDVVKLIDANGTPVVEYTYNTWGKKVTTTGSMAETLGRWQPFRYRGYVYDYETGFYYLQSRYYDPTTGRFISSDVLLSTGQGVLGHNCYAYCLDNPVNMVDDSGSAARTTRWEDDSYIIDYGAISLTIRGTSITITANCYFEGDIDPQELINGIKEYWEGTYVICGIDISLSVHINILKEYQDDCLYFSTERTSGTGNTLCRGDNWSQSKAHIVKIFSKLSYKDEEKNYAWTAAHEFGHCIGLTDFYKIPQYAQTVYSLLFPSFSSIMAENNNNQCVKASKYDVIKALVALVTNVKWRWWLYDEK